MDEKFTTTIERRGFRWWLVAVSERQRIEIGGTWTKHGLLALRKDKAYAAIFAGLPQDGEE